MSMRALSNWWKKVSTFEHPPIKFVEIEQSNTELNISKARRFLCEIKGCEAKRDNYVKSISRWNNWDCSRDPFSENEVETITLLNKHVNDAIYRFNLWLDADPDFGEPPPQDLMCLYQKA